ncbi:MAG: MJ1255/VC2487 family glycosyltransferase [archaeon]
MVKILYGVCGEGMGHATRSKVVIKHLIEKKHDVHVVASHRAYEFLARTFPKVTQIPGFTMHYEENTMKTLKTIWRNIKYPRSGKQALNLVYNIIKKEKPDIIITDYEPSVAYLSKMVEGKNKRGIPLISIDNQHIYTNCEIKFPKKFMNDYIMAKICNRFIVRKKHVDRYIINTFFYPKTKHPKTKLIPALIREDVIKMKPKKGKHILIYQTSKSYTAMFEILKKFKKEKFIVYGFGIENKDQNLTFKGFDEKGFIKDLASSKAAITNGGFTMMSEALFLHKPVLSVPVKKQFEQICNAVYLNKESYGKFIEEITEENMSEFINNLEHYHNNLKRYKQKDNKKGLSIIEKTIQELS